MVTRNRAKGRGSTLGMPQGAAVGVRGEGVAMVARRSSCPWAT